MESKLALQKNLSVAEEQLTALRSESGDNSMKLLREHKDKTAQMFAIIESQKMEISTLKSELESLRQLPADNKSHFAKFMELKSINLQLQVRNITFYICNNFRKIIIIYFSLRYKN